MKRFIAFCFLAVLFALVSCPLSAQTKPAKKPAVKHAAVHHGIAKHALFKIVVKGPYTGIKGGIYVVLFTGEGIVDGARVGLTGADTVFDVLSLKGKVPVLDSIYAGIGIASKDAAWADMHVENWEQDIFGTHN